MAEYRYVVIDENGKVLQDKYLSGKIQESKFEFEIPLELDIANKRFIDGQWIEYYETFQEITLENRPNPVELPEALYLQLDMIEAKIDKTQQQIIDDYTLELIKEGVI